MPSSPPVRNTDSFSVEDKPPASNDNSGASSKTTPSQKRKREHDRNDDAPQSSAPKHKKPRVKDPGSPSPSRSASAFDENGTILDDIIKNDVEIVMKSLNKSGESIKSGSIFSAIKTVITNSTTDTEPDDLAKKTVEELEKMRVKIKNRDKTQFKLEGYLDSIRRLYNEAMKKKDDVVSNDTIARVADQDFGITENLVHELDADSLLDELKKVLAWHDDATKRKRYLAPLLPIVQCSGTGKSRLLHWLGWESKHQKYSRIVLLSKLEEATVENTDNYDELYAVGTMDVGTMTDPPSPSLEKEKTRLRKLVKKLCEDILGKLGNEVKGKKPVRCILIFDEAQHLAEQNGFLLRALRWITREEEFKINNRLCQLTVVLAGTNSSLTNFYNDKEVVTGNSRELPVKVKHYESGEERFPPFFLLRTMGCLAGKFTENSEKYTEYERMIRFSRPLFAMMQKRKKKIPEFQIANKIVLGNTTDWIDSEQSCLSVLGTRVQMGSTNAALVAELVSKGYAHLTDFQNGTKEIPGRSSFAFLPDPVCARLAMCLMDRDFFLDDKDGGHIQGALKTEVVKMFGRIFSSGLCLPEKGNYGEIAVALYLLLCGDVLRKKNNPVTKVGTEQYHKLSVDFGSWMNIVEHDGTENKKGNGGSDDQAKKDYVDKQKANRSFQLNCIQFFRNPLRFPLKTLATDEFLEPLYEKGCAIYCATNMEAVDLVIPLKKIDNATNKPGDDEYFPVFVSVKNYGHMKPIQAAGFLETSLNKLNDADVKTGVLLLAIAGQDRSIQKESQETWQDTFQKTVYENLSDDNKKAVDATLSDVHEKLVARIVLIHEDVFGIHGALLAGGIQRKQQTSEVYQYHSELLHRDLGDENLTSKYRAKVKTFMEKTMNCIKNHENEKAKNANAASYNGVDATDASE